MTPHAWQRWRERHPDLDPAAEFACARRAGKRLRLLLQGPQPALDAEWDFTRQYLITDSGVVFVVSPSDQVVVTVLRLAEAKRRARALRRAHKGATQEWIR